MKRLWCAVVGAVGVTLVATPTMAMTRVDHGAGSGVSAAAATAGTAGPDCDNQLTTRVSGTLPGEFNVLNPGDNRTYDLRNLTTAGAPVAANPIAIGRGEPPRYFCLQGGTVKGTTAIDSLWRQQLYTKYGGYGVALDTLRDHPGVIDGVRVDRTVDGFGPVGDGIALRNAYVSNSRDDCVESDFLSSGLIEDSLLDGCFAGISVDSTVRPSPVNPEPLVLDHVLMRMKPFMNNPSVIGNTLTFKIEASAHVVVRDSVILMDQFGLRSDQFRGAETENVTVVWLGNGAFPGPVPPGVTVVTDPNVWEQARNDWLTRHGYPLLPEGPSLVPAPPTTGGQPSLTWTLGSGAESYRVKRSVTSGGPYDTVAELPATARTYTDTAAEPGVRYYYAVSAVNSHGEGDNSNEAIALVAPASPTVPGQVQNFQAKVDPNPHGQELFGEGRVNLTWNHVAGAQEYVVRRGTAPGVYDTQAVTRTNSYDSVSLRPQGTTFYFQVEARNVAGTGTPSPEASATPERADHGFLPPRFDPWQLPTELQSSRLGAIAGDGRITLSWMYVPRETGVDAFFYVKRSTAPGGPYQQIAQVGPSTGNSVAAPTYVDTGLQNGQTYYYVVQSSDGEVTGPESQEIAETPQASPVLPGVVPHLHAHATGAGVSLSWEAASLASVYTVERAATPEGPYEPLYTLVQGTTYTDYGIGSHRHYVYRVRGVNSFGQGDPSPSAVASTGTVDHTTPQVSVHGVHDGATYTLGAVPKPSFSASDNTKVAWKNGELRDPATTTGAGQYVFIATARDAATNADIVYTTYDVRYHFGGFQGGLAEPGRTFGSDEPIPVVWELTDAHGHGVTGATSVVLVDGVPAMAWPGLTKAGKGTYTFPLDPRDLSAEIHTLDVLLDDGTSRHTTFRIGEER